MGKKRGSKQPKETPANEDVPVAEEQTVEPSNTTEEVVESPVEPVPVAAAAEEPVAAAPVAEEAKPVLSVETSTTSSSVVSEPTPKANNSAIVDEIALEQNPIFQTVVFLATVVAKVALLVYNLAAVQKYLVPYATKAFERAQTFAVDINKKYAATTKATEILNAVVEDLERYDITRDVVIPRSKQGFEVARMVQERVVRYFDLQ